MKVVPARQTAATKNDADAVVVGVFADSAPSGAAGEIDKASGGLIARLIERKEFSGKKFELVTLIGPPGVAAGQVVVIGLGPRDAFDAGVAYRASAAAAKHLSSKPRKRVAFFLDEKWSADKTEAGIAGAIAGCQGQDLYRAEKKQTPFGELQWAGGDKRALVAGEILGEAVNLTRRLVNEPPDNLYPETFAAQAKKVAADCGLDCEIWDEKRLARERCGALLAVAKGSSRPPRLVILRYHGGKKKAPVLALVGKGVTFDSGGLSLKTPDNMLTMKCDMAGAATVLGAMQAIARLELPVHVIGLMGLVENMTGPEAYKLGDVLTARNGRTIEVHNTDAEGRLVLADVLSVTVDQGAARIIDLATLTGACVVALGTDVAGLMTNNQEWCDEVSAAAQACGEPVWQLPMFPEYTELIQSEVADIKNVGEGRWGGAITAAKLLEEFVAGLPWTHFDIAGPAFLDKPKPWSAGGASGAFVRTLVQVAREWK